MNASILYNNIDGTVVDFSNNFGVKLLLLLLLQRLRVETREEVIVTERGREQISRASFSPTIEKTRHPPSESRASSSSPPPPSPPPRPPPRHPVHLLKTFPNASKFLKSKFSLILYTVDSTVNCLLLCIDHLENMTNYTMMKASVLIALAMAAGTGGVVAGELELNHECSLMHWSPEDFESKLQGTMMALVDCNWCHNAMYIKFRLRKGNTGLISSDLVVASPVEDYFLYIDDQKNPEKEEAEKITQPILDALGED
ncbi:Histone-lysine N-methyltransferase [Arachis hypogaea]|nr:Histone-lysine N-methyltransferase [Arachis hypogaea]